MLAIDWGSARIKVAYLLAGAREPALCSFAGHPWLTSCAYVPDGNDASLIFGDAASELARDHPRGAVSGAILCRITEVGSHRVPGRTVSAREMLTALFGHIRARITQDGIASLLASQHGLAVVVPFGVDRKAEAAIQDSAVQAGYPRESVTLILAPEATALCGLRTHSTLPDNVIVLDCGATTKWSWVRREGASFRLVPTVRPDRLDDAGSTAVDLDVLDQFQESAATDADAVALTQHRSQVLRCISRLRETPRAGDAPLEVDIGDRVLYFDSSILRASIQRRLLQPVATSFEKFLNATRLQCQDEPVILLSGGASRTRGFREAIEEFGVPVVTTGHGDSDAVRGALLGLLPPLTATHAPRPTGGNRSRGQANTRIAEVNSRDKDAAS